jgi:hypothetical protein
MFEFFHERRSAAVFFTTLMVLFGVLVLVGLAHALTTIEIPPEDLTVILICIVPFLFVFVWHWFRRWLRRGRVGRYQSTPLSQDERIKARRKLATKAVSNKR